MNMQQFGRELSALDFKKVGNWSMPIQVFVSVLAATLILGGGIYWVYTSTYDTLVSEESKEPQLKEDFERKQRKVAALDAYKDQLKEMERSFGAMLRQLPSKTEVANLLSDISQTRVAAGLEEELFQPQSEVPKEFYAEIPNNIVVVGDYHQMGSFVSAVAALPRIVTIDDVEIKPLDAKAAQLRLSAKAKTYRYLDETTAPDAAAKPGEKK
jgi:type IV pilus assembly protein PilO